MTINIRIIFLIVLFLFVNIEVYSAVQEAEKLEIISYESSCDNWSLSKDDIIAFFKNSYEEESTVLFYSEYVFYHEDLLCEINGTLKLKDVSYPFRIKQTGNGYIFGARNPPNDDTKDRLFSCNSAKCVVINQLHGTMGED